jgi:hypothetical protein
MIPLLTHPTLDQLGQLGLPGMGQAFAELEASSGATALSHADWLGLVLAGIPVVWCQPFSASSSACITSAEHNACSDSKKGSMLK